MNKKIFAAIAIALFLTSCGIQTESSTEVPAPIKIESGSLGQTNTGFTSDLSSVVEQAYQNAASGTTVTQ